MKFKNLSALVFSLLSFKFSLAYNYSTGGKCGPENNNRTCPGNQCCNKDGECGFDKNYCGTGCKPGFGYCLPSNYQYMTCSSCVECVDCDKNPRNALLCPITCIKKISNVSSDGRCGPNKICPNEECCNKDGYCGKTENHCLISHGCQPSFGKCHRIKYTVVVKTKTIIKSEPTETPTKEFNSNNNLKISTDGNCGPKHGDTICPSNKCCSKYGHCGTKKIYCDTSNGCLKMYGRCD